MDWISVKDRLPEVDSRVLWQGAFSDEYKFTGRLRRNGEWEYISVVADVEHCLSDVTHWMPLPPPPTTKEPQP